jgi:hypothetical protein
LELGDRLYEGAGTFISRAGRLVGLMQDPCQAGHMFLLAVQADNRLTIYHGWGNGTHLALARNLPANVFCEFCGIVQAGIAIHDTPDDDEPPAPVSGKKPPTKETDGGDSPPPIDDDQATAFGRAPRGRVSRNGKRKPTGSRARGESRPARACESQSTRACESQSTRACESQLVSFP